MLADTEDTWNRIFAEAGGEYAEPALVLFEGAVDGSSAGTSFQLMMALKTIPNSPWFCQRQIGSFANVIRRPRPL